MDAVNPETGLTQETLEEQLVAYRKSIEEEFNTKMEVAPENAEKHSQDFFRAQLPSAAAQVVYLMENADSDSIKLRAALAVIAEAKEAGGDSDPVQKLIDDLMSKSTITAKEIADKAKQNTTTNTE